MIKVVTLWRYCLEIHQLEWLVLLVSCMVVKLIIIALQRDLAVLSPCWPQINAARADKGFTVYKIYSELGAQTSTLRCQIYEIRVRHERQFHCNEIGVCGAQRQKIASAERPHWCASRTGAVSADDVLANQCNQAIITLLKYWSLRRYCYHTKKRFGARGSFCVWFVDH